MIRDRSIIKGCVIFTVFDKDGNIKRFDCTVLDKLLKRPGRLMIVENHNLVTNEGDALIADQLSETPTQTKVDNANGKIGVGTGYVAALKTTDALVAQVGVNEGMDATYPKQKGAFLAANDNVTQYRATFEAGDLNANGIDEALLGNGVDTLAYAEINPAVNVAVTDTLQVDWEITYLGA